jgi:hypothetical protein
MTRCEDLDETVRCLAEQCAVACRSEAFPSTATYETRIERVLRSYLIGARGAPILAQRPHE